MADTTELTTILTLPDEVIQNILAYATLPALIATCQTNRRLSDLSNEILLWRRHCVDQYRFWHPKHDFPRLLTAPPGTVNWKKILIQRKEQDQSVKRCLDEAIETQIGRVQNLENVTELGYDAKDVLQSIIDETPGDASDGLARKYWANEALGCIERGVAMTEWRNLISNSHYPLERALGAIDLFALERPQYTLEDISSYLDHLADEFRSSHPNFDSLSTREKAQSLVTRLIAQDFAAVDQDDYYNLQNSLIGVALFQQDHPALPLTVSAIYTCLARRLGLDANLCNFPLHICCIVRAPAGYNLDGQQIPPPPADAKPSEREEYMDQHTLYMDPFYGHETPISELRARLGSYGVPIAMHSHYLAPASTLEILHRTSGNIINALSRTGSHFGTCLDLTVEDQQLPNHGKLGPCILNPFRARYCGAYINVSLNSHTNRQAQAQDAHALYTRTAQMHRHLTAFTMDFETHFRYTDCPLVERFLMRDGDSSNINNDGLLFESFEQLPRQLRKAREQDLGPAHIHRRLKAPGASAATSTATAADDDVDLPLQERTWPVAGLRPVGPSPHDDETGKVAFRIGTVFQHARYNYKAVITGWDTACQADPAWIAQMQVDALPGGRGQPFYHVMVEDMSVRYVAQENILPLGKLYGNQENERWEGRRANREVEPGDDLMRTAGRWFLRWNAEDEHFVSNVREEWPDD